MLSMYSTIVIILGFSTICIILGYMLRTDTITRRRLFDTQIAMAQAQQAMTKDLEWEQIKKIINEVLEFVITNYILVESISKLTDTEFNLQMAQILSDICTKTDLFISDEIKRQFNKYTTDEYFKYYMTNSARLILVYKMEMTKKTSVPASKSQT